MNEKRLSRHFHLFTKELPSVRRDKFQENDSFCDLNLKDIFTWSFRIIFFISLREGDRKKLKMNVFFLLSSDVELDCPVLKEFSEFSDHRQITHIPMNSNLDEFIHPETSFSHAVPVASN